MLTQTGLEASHLSQHLSVLRRYGLVVSERRASVVYYRLAYPQVADLRLSHEWWRLVCATAWGVAGWLPALRRGWRFGV